MIQFPKDTDKYQWTQHVKDKMIYYHLSESLIKRIVRFPKRIETGIVPGTVVVMQRNDRIRTIPGKKKKMLEEIWVMYQVLQEAKSKGQIAKSSAQKIPSSVLLALGGLPRKRIISAWRYPGESPIGKPIPIPDEILQELENII